MTEISGLLDMFSKVGLPLGLLVIVLLAIKKVCLWLKPWIERLFQQHAAFLDAATASQASATENFKEVHAANQVTHQKLDELRDRVEKIGPRPD